MSSREKLIELLKSPHKAEQLREMGVDIGAYHDDCIEAMIADFLLANGVTVRVNEKVQDEIIIKALECCSGGDPDDCNDCPLCNHPNLITTKACTEFVTMHALNIINRQKAEIEHTNQMLQAAIAGQETLQRYLVSKDSPDGIRLRYNEATGEWNKYEPYMTIECPEEKDYKFIETAIQKQIFKKPSKESLADYGCPTCGSHINFDSLNGKIEHAPKHCSECGQRLDWRKDNEHKPD